MPQAIFTIALLPFTCARWFLLRLWYTLHSTLRRQDHFAPHPDAAFEGFYSRTQLSNGGTLAVVFCWVHKARKRPNLIHISYTPVDAGTPPSFPAFKHELFPESVVLNTHQSRSAKGKQAFTITMHGVGSMTVDEDSVEYDISCPSVDLHLTLQLTNRVPWAPDALAGPMGWITALAPLLPLNWDVYSTASSATCSMTHAGRTLSDTGISHIEKNWGTSFPRGWIWCQAFARREERKSLCLAGGAALPFVQAYLVGYRSPRCHWDFRPPFTVAVLGISPSMRVDHDSRAGTFTLSVQTFTRKLVVHGAAPPGSFIGLSCPLLRGHQSMYAFESFKGRTYVQAWTRRWPWGEWQLVEEGVVGINEMGVPCAAVEFGGSYCHLVHEAVDTS